MQNVHSRRLVALGAAVALVAPAVLATTAAPAQAAKNKTPGCVTKAEYKKAKKGMSKKKVKKIFGTNGKKEASASAGGFRTEVRAYKTCVEFGAVSVSFTNGKMDGKSGVFM